MNLLSIPDKATHSLPAEIITKQYEAERSLLIQQLTRESLAIPTI